MNIEKLIEAAQEIDRLAEKQELMAAEYSRLAAAARKAKTDIERANIRYQAKNLGTTVVDFGTAINALRAALKAKPTKRTPSIR